MILVDTGPLVAAANRRDAHHAVSVAALAAARPPRLVPGLVIAEGWRSWSSDTEQEKASSRLRNISEACVQALDGLVLTPRGDPLVDVEEHRQGAVTGPPLAYDRIDALA